MALVRDGNGNRRGPMTLEMGLVVEKIKIIKMKGENIIKYHGRQMDSCNGGLVGD